MKKNLYRILGVHPGADPARIKRAYRCAAKRYHPDISPKDEERFKEVQSAYETLSDPKKKAVYDEQLLTSPARESRSYFPPGFVSSPVSFFGEMGNLFSNLDDFLNGELNTLFGIDEDDRGDLAVEVILTREEATRGCEIPVEIPFLKECSRCQGTGRAGYLICGRCRGDGKEKLLKAIEIKIPSGVKSGTVMRKRMNLDGTRKDLFIAIEVQSL